MRTIAVLGALACLFAASAACRDPLFLDSNDGNLGAPCHADGTCNAGLYCAVDLCEPIPDAPPRPDAQPRSDAAVVVDAAPPAMPSGSIAVLDISMQGYPGYGWGGYLGANFMVAAEPAPAYDDRDDSGLGCRAWVYDADVPATMPPALVDQGRLHISGAGVTVPACDFLAPLAAPLANNSYECLFTAGSGFFEPTGVGGIVLLHDPDHSFSGDEIGAQAVVAGGANAATNGMHPVVGVASGSLELYNPAQTVGEGASYRIVAVAGPAPGTPDFLAGGEEVLVRMDGGHDIPAFAQSVPAGSSFSLASGTDLRAIDPTSSSPLTLAAQPDDAGSGTITMIALDTSDGDTSGVAPTILPPAQRSVRVRCGSASPAATIPAEVLALIADTSPTRIRTSLLRVNVGRAETVDLFVGHAISGVTDL